MPRPSDSTPITAATRYCAVLGHPIQHSASPPMQNAGIAELGLDWKYLAFDVRPEELKSAIHGAKSLHFVGLNLTVPHKLLAMKFVDELDETASRWGAVNTIRFEGQTRQGAWTPVGSANPFDLQAIRSRGFNTDADAVVRSIREDLQIELAGSSVLLLGAGGAGRVAAHRIACENPKGLALVNRTREKAGRLAGEIRRRHPRTQVTLGYPKDRVDLVVNATSLGLHPQDPLPIDPAKIDLTAVRAAYDLIYQPAETPFLRMAKTAGCQTANGLGMLLYQGARALEIWASEPAPIAAMRRTLKRHVYGGS